jgi:23S rRNA pseudouridine2605 synthase
MSKKHNKEADLIRLQKYIADCGICSRRKAETLITDGHVKVNGVKVTELGTKVDPMEDSVMLKGEIIDHQRVDNIYVVVNKPRSYVTTVNDPEGRRTVMDLVAPIKQRIFPVGRLDYLSEGLLLMTNDGDLANMIMHPKFEVVKTYEVKVFGRINEVLLKKLRAGTSGPDGSLRPLSVRIIETLPNKTWLEFRLNEGKNREIRRICEAADVTIDKLKRVAIGALSINGIKPGDWEYVTKKDLLAAIGLNKDGTKAKREVKYLSPKRTVNSIKAKKKQKHAKVASDVAYSRYKKDSYYETIRIQKEVIAKKREEEAKKELKGIEFVVSTGKNTQKPSKTK